MKTINEKCFHKWDHKVDMIFISLILYIDFVVRHAINDLESHDKIFAQRSWTVSTNYKYYETLVNILWEIFDGFRCENVSMKSEERLIFKKKAKNDFQLIVAKCSPLSGDLRRS